jgi:glutamate/tyrosine decarboxylase-like PLP-dependent enzyme
VSPVLTLVEKYTAKRLANLFGFDGPHAGGISQSGGSAGNSTSIVIARNTLYPETKTQGLGNHRFTLFTSAHGHYSLEKAAQIFGFGSDSIISVPVDEEGKMIPSELDRLIKESKAKGQTPFYVNATAGTTVMGSFDPFNAIADICEAHGLWMHVDGSWGGAVVFNKELAAGRMDGLGRANSAVMCAHKMLGVPVSCSFLVGKDLRQFWKALTLPAG